MNDVKNCEHCHEEMQRGNLNASNWRTMKVHKHCKREWDALRKRKAFGVKYDTCKHCGETKPIARFKQAKDSPKGYRQPCKACDCAKNKRGGKVVPDTSYLDRYLTIPWTRAA